MPVAVEDGDEEREHEKDAERDDRDARGLLERRPVVEEGIADPRCGHAEQHEDEREGEDEERRAHEHASKRGSACAFELRRRQPADRGEVAGYERQHARRGEGDEACREGEEDARRAGIAHRS